MNAYNLNKEKHRRQRGVYYFWTFPQGFLHWKERFLSLPAMRTRLSTECMSLETSVKSTSSCSVCFQVNLYFISRVWADMMHHVRCNVSAKPESVEEGWQNSCVVYYRLSSWSNRARPVRWWAEWLRLWSAQPSRSITNLQERNDALLQRLKLKSERTLPETPEDSLK